MFQIANGKICYPQKWIEIIFWVSGKKILSPSGIEWIKNGSNVKKISYVTEMDQKELKVQKCAVIAIK